MTVPIHRRPRGNALSPAEGTLDQSLEHALLLALSHAGKSMDAASLLTREPLRAYAQSPHKVATCLDKLWRAGKLLRLPAAGGNSPATSRWLYLLNPGATPPPSPARSNAARTGMTGLDSVLNRPRIEVTEEGDEVLFTLPGISIAIRSSRQ